MHQIQFKGRCRKDSHCKRWSRANALMFFPQSLNTWFLWGFIQSQKYCVHTARDYQGLTNTNWTGTYIVICIYIHISRYIILSLNYIMIYIYIYTYAIIHKQHEHIRKTQKPHTCPLCWSSSRQAPRFTLMKCDRSMWIYWNSMLWKV